MTGLLMERLNDSGELYLRRTKMNGRVWPRLAVGAPATEAEHVTRAWGAVRTVAAEVDGRSDRQR